MFAVVNIGGKQYKVQEGDIIYVEKLDAEENQTVSFNQVLALSKENDFTVGNPTVSGVTVSANVVKQGKAKKIYVMTYKSKKNEKKKQGHRQPFTKLQITNINA